MSWKNSLPYFAFQSVKYARNFQTFQQFWSFYKRWKTSLSAGHNSMADESAWINFAAIDYLNNWLQPEHKVFEYGGGGSTLFFLKRAGFVATVENHNQWFDILSQAVEEKGYQHWKGFYIEGQPVSISDPRDIQNPKDYKSNVAQFSNLSFEAYARAVEQFPERYFDLILVDGRARPSCIYHAIPRLKKGGLLVIDNNERPYYTTAFKEIFAKDFSILLDGRNVIPYIPDFVKTTILRYEV